MVSLRSTSRRWIVVGHLFYVTVHSFTIHQTLWGRHGWPKHRHRHSAVMFDLTATHHAVHQSPPSTIMKPKNRDSFPKRAVKIYMQYAGRLWNETNPEVRRRIASDRTACLLRNLNLMIRNEEHLYSGVSEETRKQLVDACERVLSEMKTNNTASGTSDSTALSTMADGYRYTNNGKAIVNGMPVLDEIALNATSFVAVANTKIATPALGEQQLPAGQPKKRRSILFGAMMGVAVACWVFSGNYIFTGLFTLMTVLGQLEYYRMVINTGVYPARRISIVGACSMFLTALFTPSLHQICLPLFGLWAMIWFLTVKRSPTSIPEIATTFTGMFYLGYVPSFWVRIRLLGSRSEPTRLAPIAAPILSFLARKAEANLPAWVPQAVHLPITKGAIFIFWSWLCLAFSDVGAYFVGKNFGKTKLGTIAPAAGATSPNKTVEGVVGGCAASALLAIIGAWVQRWPYFWVTGAIHGLLLGLLGLIGDLTASMLKRDAGLKDFGDLIPEHGGIMDRVDSFVWSAPYCWLVCAYIIPALKTWATA